MGVGCLMQWLPGFYFKKSQSIQGCPKDCVIGSIQLIYLPIHLFHEHPFSHSSWETLTCGAMKFYAGVNCKGGPDGFLPLSRACLKAHYSLQTKQNKSKKTPH